jgi:phosphatidylglycerophosphate synthase
MGLFLPVDALPGLKKYKYSAVDNSPISKYILKPFYSRFVLLFPEWFAPNLITLSGLAFVLINVAEVLWFNPTLDQESPQWVYLTYAIGLFLYQTFDACDGLQARRTGTSSPLGELFDHCCDALNTTLAVLVFSATSNFSPLVVLAAQFATLFNFYLTTWEEYHTGTLFLSAFSGPVEGILVVCVCYLVTFITGGTVVWKTPLADLLYNNGSYYLQASGLPELLANTTLTDIYLTFAIVGLGFNIVQSSSNVIKVCEKRGEPYLPALTQVLPFLTFYGSVVAWIIVCPTLYRDHLLPLLFANGFIFALIVGQIITCHVTKQPFPRPNPLTYMPLVGIGLHQVGLSLDWNVDILAGRLIWGILGLSLGVYGCFIGEVISEITAYLDIGCLHIKKRKEE